MTVFKSVKFAGKDLREFGVVCSGVHTHNAPQRTYTAEAIPGRNGDLLMHGTRLQNKEIIYDCSIVPYFSNADFSEQIQDLRNHLLVSIGYQRLEDDFHPLEYHMAYYEGPLEADVGFLEKWGTFTLTFKCRPQRYLKGGDEGTFIEFGNSAKFTSPTGPTAFPTIRVDINGTPTPDPTDEEAYQYYTDESTAESSQDTGNADANTRNCIDFNGRKLYFDPENVGVMIIDCDARRAYEQSTKRDLTDHVSAEVWPYLGYGETTVTNNSNFDIMVYPKWWII